MNLLEQIQREIEWRDQVLARADVVKADMERLREMHRLALELDETDAPGTLAAPEPVEPVRTTLEIRPPHSSPPPAALPVTSHE